EEEMRREIRILSVLDHPHLVKARDVVRQAEPGNGPALAMDYAAGGSLAQLVAARGGLSVGETVTVLTPIAQALGYLHGKGFTHSDVSPGNVLFTGQGKPLLSDLGVARMMGDPGSTEAAGTKGFLDPAPVDAVRAGLQPERDVYSAAALGWFCLTGAAPGRTANRPPLSLLVPGVPPGLAAALEAGLNEDRRLRPGATALATAVYRSAAPEPLDLAGAVHPTVLPELLTRRNIPAAPHNRVRAGIQRLHRRAVTFRRSALPAPVPTPALTQPKAGPPARGKHAEKPGGGSSRPRLLRAVVPVLAAAGAAIWWLSAIPGADLKPGHAVTGPPSAPAPVASAPGGANGVEDARERASATDPVAAVLGLAALRDYALSSGRLELLAEVNAPGSAAAAADEQIAGQLRPSGRRFDGFTTTLSQVAAEDGAGSGHAVVRVLSATSGYRAVDADGAVLAAGEPGRPQPLRLVLESVEGQWRVSDILAAP
ncbi:MAG: serine/threonine-protein kinase, partial [Actinomycetes bacterium]